MKDDATVLAEHIPADDVCEVMASVDGHASIYDDADGSLVADTHGDPAMIAALAMLLEDHELRTASP